MTLIGNRRFSSGFIGVLATMAIVLALSAPAFAQSTLNGYGDQAGKSQSQVEGALQNGGGGSGNAPASQSTPSQTKAVSASNSSKSLPFTGLELGLMLAVGGSLIAVGVGLRRIVRLRPPVA